MMQKGFDTLLVLNSLVHSTKFSLRYFASSVLDYVLEQILILCNMEIVIIVNDNLSQIFENEAENFASDIQVDFLCLWSASMQ